MSVNRRTQFDGLTYFSVFCFFPQFLQSVMYFTRSQATPWLAVVALLKSIKSVSFFSAYCIKAEGSKLLCKLVHWVAVLFENGKGAL